MKKLVSVLMIALFSFSFLLFNEHKANAETNGEVEFVPKADKILWNQFKSMLDGNYQNQYNPVMSWNPIQTNRGEATSYRVTVSEVNKEGKLEPFPTLPAYDTSFTHSYVVSEGEAYHVKIEPRVGFSKADDEYNLEFDGTVQVDDEQVSPVTFNDYTNEYYTVEALLDAIDKKRKNSNLQDSNTNGIFENIMKIYLNDFEYDSLAFINNGAETKELLIKAETIVTPIAQNNALTRDEKQVQILQALKDLYAEKQDTILVDITPKTVSLLWGDFKDIMNNRNYQNVFYPVVSWKAIETESGVASGYRLTIKTINEDGTSKSLSFGGITDTTYTPDFAIYEGKTYEVTITPKVGFSYKTNNAITMTYKVPQQSKQVSPVKFNDYSGKLPSLSALANAINLKVSTGNPSTIYEQIAKFYVNEGVISSTEMLNNPDKTNQLLEDAELLVTPIVVGNYSPSDELLLSVANELITLYQQNW